MKRDRFDKIIDEQMKADGFGASPRQGKGHVFVVFMVLVIVLTLILGFTQGSITPAPIYPVGAPVS